MTAGEQAKFDKQMEQIAAKTKAKVVEVCAEISLPLEIEALEKMVEMFKSTIEAKKYMLSKIKETK